MKNYLSKLKFFFLAIAIIGLPLIASGQTAAPASSNPSSTGDDEIVSLNKDIKQHRDRIKELEDTIATYKKEISKKQTEAVSLSNQLTILNSRIKQVQNEVELLKEKITTTQLEINAFEQIIAEKKTILERQKVLLASMLQKIQSDDQRNTLEILLTNDSFADFYSQLQNLEQVNSDLSKSVQLLRQTKEDLEVKKLEVEKRKKAFESLKRELEGRQEQYEEQTDFKEKLLTETKSSEARFQTLVKSLRQEYQQTEDQVRAAEEKLRKKLAAQKNGQQLPTGNVAFDWPVTSHRINASFHDPDYPFRNVVAHSGLDIQASQGTPVRAAAAGYVLTRTYCTVASCLNFVVINHTATLSTRYLHLSSISVQPEQFVNKGDIIGKSGATPGTVGAGRMTTGPHLHFEVRQNGIPVDPLGYLIQ